MKAIFMLPLLAAAVFAQTKRPAEPLWKRILRFAGLAANPVETRGSTDYTQAGDLWIYDRKHGTRCQLTTDQSYRSPIFLPGDQFLLALRRGRPVRLPVTGGAAEEMRATATLSRLVASNTISALVFMDDGSPATLDLRSGAVSRLPAERSDEDSRLLEQYRGPSRIYDGGKLEISVRPMEDRSGLEPLRWTDVFLREQTVKINASDCDGAPCGQPALSFDRSRLVYVRGRVPR